MYLFESLTHVLVTSSAQTVMHIIFSEAKNAIKKRYEILLLQGNPNKTGYTEDKDLLRIVTR